MDPKPRCSTSFSETISILFSARLTTGRFRFASPKHARKELLAYLTCGHLCRGFARLKCRGCREGGFEAATQFLRIPKIHWSRIHSTNGVERLHGEIKRRTRAVGAFPDRQSALRLITAVALEATAIWSDRRYLDTTVFKATPENELMTNSLKHAFIDGAHGELRVTQT